MLCTLAGIYTSTNLFVIWPVVYPANASISIFFNYESFANITFYKLAHDLKAPYSIISTYDGIYISFKGLPRNACDSITSNFFGRSIFVILHSRNALSLISFNLELAAKVT